MIGAGPILCFGELLFRLSTPVGTRLMQAEVLDVAPGGAEANVAVGLARLGTSAAMASTLPLNDLAAAMRTTLRGAGIDTSLVRDSFGGRMGLYFYTSAGVGRPAEVLYDRAGSMFALDPAVDLGALTTLAPTHIHISGITPAVSAAASQATLDLLDWAGENGVTSSFDGNYRAKLWDSWGGNGPSILREIVSRVQIAFLDWRDISLILGIAPEGETHQDRNSFAYRAAFDAFGSLRLVAATCRRILAHNHHMLAASAQSRAGEKAATRELNLAGIVDRIGSGDAFVAGFLHALRSGQSLEHIVAFALTCGAVKHGERGDMPSSTEAEILRLMTADAQDVQR